MPKFPKLVQIQILFDVWQNYPRQTVCCLLQTSVFPISSHSLLSIVVCIPVLRVISSCITALKPLSKSPYLLPLPCAEMSLNFEDYFSQP